MKKTFTIILSIISFVAFAQQAKLTSAALGKMEARHIGPAVMGGRITAIEGYNKDPRIIYVGTAGGGVWKTTNGGSQFKPVFDKHCQSIGAVAVDQTNSDVVWVGTGESNTRNSVSIGDGLYKTTDGGENWVKIGLENSERISKIIISPKDANILYVSVPGHLWNDSPDRGLYKTTDGGKTWSKILYIDEKTGCADVAIDPRNPDVVYATMWQFRRKPYAFISGPEKATDNSTGGVFKSTDGGKTWKRIENGLPAGKIGRSAIALAPSAPDNIVAIVESIKTGLYISDNGGETWKAQSADENVTARPFYFSTIGIDPNDPKRVYRPAFEFSYSEDGGYSWIRAQNSSGWVHSDMHALWINPKNTSHMYLGTDGGVYMSTDRGNNWVFLNSIPVSQFYHVQVDQQDPYYVYGGLQDNGSWKAPSQNNGGIKNGDWKGVGWGDGFWVQPDREDNTIVYSEYQGGHASRVNTATNQYQDIQPQPMPGEPKLRFNWNTPIVTSETNKKRIYMGAQYLYKSDNKGITWDRISPDLTTNDPAKTKQEESGGLTVDNSSAENHCTIFTITESPLDGNVIWVGTDDGNLQLSTDAGKTWTNLANNYKACGVPAQTWVSSIEPSRFDKNVVYVTFDNHMYGDMKTYVAKSEDMGKTWKMLSSPVFKGYAHKVREDIKSKNLLFVGTEWGLYLSTDGGNNWVQMKARIPEYLAIRDIIIEPKTNDLVLGTHGRGVLIVDDISPLRAVNDQLLNAEASILPSRPTPVTNGHYGQGWPDAGSFIGPNSTEEAMITYYLKNRVNSGDVKVDIYDADGKMLVSLPGTKRKGINKITWNMRIKPPRVAQGGAKADWSSTVGPMVLEGTYTVKLSVNNKTYDGKLELIQDPKTAISKEDRKLNHETVMTVFNMHEELAFLMEQILSLQKPVKGYLEQNKNAAAFIKEYADSLESVRKLLVATKEGTAITGEEKIREKLSDLYYGVNFYEGRPSDSQLMRIKGLQKEIDDARKHFETIHNKFTAKMYKELQKSGAKPLTLFSKDDFNKL